MELEAGYLHQWSCQCFWSEFQQCQYSCRHGSYSQWDGSRQQDAHGDASAHASPDQPMGTCLLFRRTAHRGGSIAGIGAATSQIFSQNHLFRLDGGCWSEPAQSVLHASSPCCGNTNRDLALCGTELAGRLNLATRGSWQTFPGFAAPAEGEAGTRTTHIELLSITFTKSLTSILNENGAQ